MKTAIALDTGFYGGSRIRQGQKFAVADNAKAKWFEVLAPEPKAAKDPKDPKDPKAAASGGKSPADDLA
ncbi:hypothetical protein A7J71_11325 [Achromobacter insolitus]|uniref:hypothetical protein n=1 Tax=Achromobacter insolitus TaxID=217204 RepID=UPI0007C793DC|nr:hypothetical protein [Achromobacter insolitus]OAE72603.1 hypothetical protein A7J71_11325 [Achromobacter insolitus]